MSYLVKQYMAKCKQEFSQYGFKRRGNNHIRVINDVMQNFFFKIYRGGGLCTVNFGVAPLCCRVEKMHIEEGPGLNNLSWFERNPITFTGEWVYDKHSQENMDACVNAIISHMKKYLIPFFESANDCKSAYGEIYELEAKYMKSGVIVADYRKYCMALKNGDYDAALIHIRAIEHQHLWARNSMEERGLITEKYKENVEKRLKIVRHEIALVEKPDLEFIENLIWENESYSRDTLKKF